MDFTKFVEWVFYGVVSAIGVYGVSILSNLNQSVKILNERVAVIIEKTAWHEKWLERHDLELNRLDNNKKNV